MAGFSTKDFGAGKYTVMGGVLRGNYHYGQRLKGIPEKMDLYAGLNLGYYALSYKVNGNKVTGVGIDNGFLALAGQAGMRYKLASKLSGLVEVGGGAGISGLRLGISYNIKLFKILASKNHILTRMWFFYFSGEGNQEIYRLTNKSVLL
jgi:hypothetical protein